MDDQISGKREGIFYSLMAAAFIVPLMIVGLVISMRSFYQCFESYFALFGFYLLAVVFLGDALLYMFILESDERKSPLVKVFTIATGVSLLTLFVALLFLFQGEIIDWDVADHWLSSIIWSLVIDFLLHLLPLLALNHIYKRNTEGHQDMKYRTYGYNYRTDYPSHYSYDDDPDDDPAGDSSSWLDNFDPTRDYYGKHGEFDRNDDSWGTSEYIRQFRNSDPDVDLSDHFDWQERLDAESDGFTEDD